MTSANTNQATSDEVVYGYVLCHHLKELTRNDRDLVKRCIAGEDLSDEWPATVDYIQSLVDEAYAVLYAGQRLFLNLGPAQI